MTLSGFDKVIELCRKYAQCAKVFITSNKRYIPHVLLLALMIINLITALVPSSAPEKEIEDVSASLRQISVSASDSVKMKPQSEPTGFVIITGDSVNVRLEANAESEILTYIESKGGEYDFLGDQTDSNGKKWYRISLDNTVQGWVSSEFAVRIDYSEEYIEDYINALIKTSDTVGIQVAVFEHGQIINQWSLGYAQLPDVPMGDSTKIRVASLSKVMVAIDAMKMQELGIIDVDSSISDYWSCTLPKKVTVRNLLSHTSTLWEQDYPHTMQETRKQLTASSSYANYEVGSVQAWKYNNYAIGIAGSTLEAASNTTLESFEWYHFFDPMDIDASWYSGNFDSDELAELYYSDGTIGRSAHDGTQMAAKENIGESAGYFAGSLTISAGDYAKLAAMLANDGIYDGTPYLSVDSVAAIEHPLLTITENNWSFEQCMPLRYKKELFGEDEIYYHTGNAYGVLSLVSYNPNTTFGVVVITTGAPQHRDAQGIYMLCSQISEFIYKAKRG